MEYLNPELSRELLLEQSALSLAYVGDSVYELMVRTHLCARKRTKPGVLHRAAIAYVSAPAQSEAVPVLLPLLSEEEREVFRRGRNAAAGHVPRNASQREYHQATGLEALFGYLYLLGRQDRLEELFAVILAESGG